MVSIDRAKNKAKQPRKSSGPLPGVRSQVQSWAQVLPRIPPRSSGYFVAIWYNRHVMADMQYAIVKTGGKQYRVSPGTRLVVEKLPHDVGSEVTLNEVLLVRGESETQVGAPVVPGAKVVAEVVRQGKGPKILVFKKRPKKTYKKIMGHRQLQTELLVKEIRLN